jgi:hypothetical protein
MHSDTDHDDFERALIDADRRGEHGGEDVESLMVDLVSDLRIVAQKHNIDWTKVVDLAELHCEAEFGL